MVLLLVCQLCTGTSRLCGCSDGKPILICWTLGCFSRSSWTDMACFMDRRWCIWNAFRMATWWLKRQSGKCWKYWIPTECNWVAGNRFRRRLYRNPGPNFSWHVDSYDTLKPYGICINSAIDVFSRMVIWLQAYCTSSDPKVIAGHLIDEVLSRNGTATRIRSDLGTENCYVEQLQMFMRHDHMDAFSRRCYLHGSSNHNQQLEHWWGFLRKQHAQFWINAFRDLNDSDYFSGDFLDKSMIQFTCLEIIQVRYL